MRRIVLSVLLLVSAKAFSQNQFLQIHTSSAIDTYELVDEDSVYVDASQTNLIFTNNGVTHSYLVSDVSHLSFTNDVSKNVYIEYNVTSATVTNPLASAGVTIDVSGAGVTVNSTSTEKNINYILSGNSSAGFFKVYSLEKYNVLLNGVNLTNPTGPVINAQSDKKATIHLVYGSSSTFTDGTTYAAAPVVNSVTEDQKAAIFGEGQLEFIGGGSVTVNGLGSSQHAIASDEEIDIKEGIITVASGVKDGLHGSEGVYVNGGSITSTTTGDGIDGEVGAVEINCGDIAITSTTADTKAICSDSTLTVNGGTIQLTLSGNASKGLKSKQPLYINGGTITATHSGNTVLTASGSGQDASYPSLISSDSTITINGGSIVLNASGKGVRGIKGGENVNINGGEIEITEIGNGATYTNSTGTATAYHSATITIDGNLNISDGNVTLSNSGTGGKGIMVDGTATVGTATSAPTVSITTTGTAITITAGGGGGPGGGNSGVYDKPKAMKADGAVTVNNGTVTIHSADDGIKSLTSITINGGDLTIANSTEGMESPNITVNGGNVSITASDDGFNATQGTVSGGTESNDGSLLKITGGYCYVSATGGDAVDSNGGLQISGGTLVVHGPTSSPELGLDYNGTGTISGGFAVISGPGQQMLQGFGTASSQKSFILKTSSSIAANTLFHVEDANGNELFTFKPVRNYMTMVFSSPAIVNGTYKIYTSGSHSGTATDGLYSGGTYTAGTLKATFTVSGTVTTVSF